MSLFRILRISIRHREKARRGRVWEDRRAEWERMATWRVLYWGSAEYDREVRTNGPYKSQEIPMK